MKPSFEVCSRAPFRRSQLVQGAIFEFFFTSSSPIVPSLVDPAFLEDRALFPLLSRELWEDGSAGGDGRWLGGSIPLARETVRSGEVDSTCGVPGEILTLTLTPMLILVVLGLCVGKGEVEPTLGACQ